MLIFSLHGVKATTSPSSTGRPRRWCEAIERARILGANRDINKSLMRGSRHLYRIEMLQELLTGVEVPRPRIVS